MAPAGEKRGSVAESAPEQGNGGADPAAAEHAEHPASFDPGTETGYLRRGARSHELDPDAGAAPFDPGPEHYDGRRAKRAERRREKAERKRREKAERRERDRDEAAGLDRQERARAKGERLAAERSEREAATGAARERERRTQLESERAERERTAKVERIESRKQEQEERRRAEREERERAEAERRAEKERARAERDVAEQARRFERQRERRLREERERAEHKLAERRRRQREQKRRPAQPQPKRRPAKPAPAAATSAPADVKPAVAKAHQRRAAARRAARRPAAAAPPQTSLRRPTAKVGVALAAVVAVAVGAGVLIGLPLPVVGNSDGPATSLAETPVLSLDPGTPKGLTKGPYHPVVISDPNYGEAAAQFGAARGSRRHEGQDVFARPGTPLVAVRDGIVLDGGGGKSFYSYGGGNTLAIYSPLDDRSYIYLHMLKPAIVRAGEQVKAGQLVGLVGCTGSCDGPHLHFEVRRGRAVFGPQKKAVDPLPLLRQWPVRPVDDGK